MVISNTIKTATQLKTMPCVEHMLVLHVDNSSMQPYEPVNSLVTLVFRDRQFHTCFLDT